MRDREMTEKANTQTIVDTHDVYPEIDPTMMSFIAGLRNPAGILKVGTRS